MNERAREVLAEAFARLRAPNGAVRRELASAHPVFSPAQIEAIVPLALESWTAQSLRAIVARERPPGARAPALTAVWLAGAIPTATFSALALPLLAGSSVYAKPSSADPVSARLFAELLRVIDPEFGARLELGADLSALARAEAVVAHGSDETVALLRAIVPAQRIFVAHGHKLSLAALGPEVELGAAARALARDVAFWDGRGCLSPAHVLVVDRPRGRAATLADALARELAELAILLPRGPLDYAEAALVRERRARAALREHVRLEADPSGAWLVALEDGAALAPASFLRCVGVNAVAALDSLESLVAQLSPSLSSVAHAGFGDDFARLEASARAAGATRFCALGELQLPSLDWNHDGFGAIRSLFR